MCFNSIGFMTLIYFLDYLICFIFKYLNFMFMMHFKASPPPLHFRSCIALDLLMANIPRGLKQLPVQVKRPGKPRW